MNAPRHLHVYSQEEILRLIDRNRAADEWARRQRLPPPPDPRQIRRDWIILESITVALFFIYLALYFHLTAQLSADLAKGDWELAGIIVYPAAFLGLTFWLSVNFAVHIGTLHLLHALRVPLHLNALFTLPGVPVMSLLLVKLLSFILLSS